MTFYYKIISYLMACVFSLCSTFGGLFPQKDGEKLRVCAYLLAGDAQTVENMDASHLNNVTDLILFGGLARFDTEGKVTLCDDFDRIISAIREKTEGLNVALHLNFFMPGAVSGESWEERMASQAEELKKAFDSGVLEENIKSTLEDYDLSGAFFDYEYPVSEQSKMEFGAFLVSLAEALGNSHPIGCAISAWCADFPKEAIRALDRVELMCYDVWDKTGQHSSLRNMTDWVDQMLDLGYAAEQLDVGLPFYARPTTHEEYWYDYNKCWDKIDKAGLMEDKDRGLTISFNTPDLIFVKTRWAIKHGLGGVMVWHYACDVPADNGASLFNAIAKAKR